MIELVQAGEANASSVFSRVGKNPGFLREIWNEKNGRKFFLEGQNLAESMVLIIKMCYNNESYEFLNSNFRISR